MPDTDTRTRAQHLRDLLAQLASDADLRRAAAEALLERGGVVGVLWLAQELFEVGRARALLDDQAFGAASAATDLLEASLRDLTTFMEDGWPAGVERT